ncbi:MAG: 3-deoxy-manno-octulosonate cytidylyltransferase [Bacteroidetes bacterium]|nr:3-deoxy-manno-octulosonate cytidylyltransferase [Bacteroidota bacterium]
MKITAIIPARFASQRLPGKPLAVIHGKTMIQRVYEQAEKCKDILNIIVATDDQRILNHVKSFGGNAAMTSKSHQSGTDRCYEAAVLSGIHEASDIILNIQGDEPFINPAQISQLCRSFKRQETQIATLVKLITDKDDLFNPTKPKVVMDSNQRALYFSRASIPFFRNIEEDLWIKNHNYYKHIGIYGYRFDVLQKITSLEPSPLEIAEALEQLRWLENGFFIQAEVTDYDSISVDTVEDLEKLNNTSIEFL